jgi:co-chaperonin GroES (HSP10)
MKTILPLGQKVLVNRIIEKTDSPIILQSAKQSNTLKGVIIIKGRGSTLNSLMDIHVGDTIVYPLHTSTPVPQELQDQLSINGTLDIVDYAEIHATL